MRPTPWITVWIAALALLVFSAGCEISPPQDAARDANPPADTQTTQTLPVTPPPIEQQYQADRAEAEQVADASKLQVQPAPMKPSRPRHLALNSPGGGALHSVQTVQPPFNTETYDHIVENDFHNAVEQPLSTFSIDVDTASYANLRRFLNQGTLPPKDSIRIEELINYFPYDYSAPEDSEHPFAVDVELARAFWSPERLLARVAIKGREIDWSRRPVSNLVFLLDVSGSMNQPDKLPLLKRSLKLLVDRFGEQDRLAIVVYAGAAGLVLPSTGGEHKTEILAAIDRLAAGGSTNGGQGIRLAYRVARDAFVPGGVNRVILATDGDFNVGTTSQSDLIDLIQREAKSGVFLTVLGYGMGNYKDSTLEKLADKGNGNYAYIDTLNEARKVLVEEAGGTLLTIAKDVKIQVEFNPARVKSYRLIGYENRMLNARDFNDDRKDAGEIGAGATVTALYEIVPADGIAPSPGIDPLRYAQPRHLTEQAHSDEWFTVKLRYKQPDETVSHLIERPVALPVREFAEAGADFQFAAAVASFGMVLRQSDHRGDTSLSRVLEIASQGAQRADPYRDEFVSLVRKAVELAGSGDAAELVGRR